MNEPKNSPAKRKQFLVICTIMGSFFIHSVWTSGLLLPVKIESSGETFPGGEFVYKFTNRDYAASASLEESIGEDMDPIMRPWSFADAMYSLYLDDPNLLGGRKLRFASGYLVTNKSGKKIKKQLLAKNSQIKPPTEDDIENLPALDFWKRLSYKSVNLPKVSAAVAQFPFTNGFVSAMVTSWKVIPALRKYAEEHNVKPVVITTCSIDDGMCTHYLPLKKTKPFHLGHPEMNEYVKGLDTDSGNPIFKIPFLTKGSESGDKNEL